METEVLESGGLSGRIEPDSLGKRIQPREVWARQAHPAEISSFAQVGHVQPTSFAGGRHGFRAHVFVVAQMDCYALLDRPWQERNFGTVSLQDDRRVLANRCSNVGEHIDEFMFRFNRRFGVFQLLDR